MLPGLELMACNDLAVPMEVMQHVVRVESSFNPYAIGVVGGRLARQPRNLSEAVSTARMLESEGYNFSLGLAQINRYNLASYGLGSYEQAFEVCPNLQAGSRILAECHGRAGGDWGKAFSCYYSGNFSTGFRHGYVQKVFASWQREAAVADASDAIPLAVGGDVHPRRAARLASTLESLVLRRIQDASRAEADARATLPTQAQQAQMQQAQMPQAQMPQQAQSIESKPQPVLLQPHGAPPLGMPVAMQPMEDTSSPVPEQVSSPAAFAGGIQAVGEPPTTVTGRDTAFVF